MAARDEPTFPLLPITSALTIRRIHEMPTTARDVFIASFPKSGTTWMQNLVYQLVSAAASAGAHDGLRHVSEFAPFLEADRSWAPDAPTLAEPAAALHRTLGWRACNTHLLPGMLPRGAAARIVYVTREPKDVCTSQWHHFAHMAPDDGGFAGELPAFVDAWLAGALPFGAWRAHVDAWLDAAAAGDARILLVRYEDLKAQPARELERVAAHLGLRLPEPLARRALGRLDFAWMKRHARSFEPRTVRWVPRAGDQAPFSFLRRGQTGDAPNLLDAATRDRIDAATAPTAARVARVCAGARALPAVWQWPALHGARAGDEPEGKSPVSSPGGSPRAAVVDEHGTATNA
jgi:hypothetical protein